MALQSIEDWDKFLGSHLIRLRQEDMTFEEKCEDDLIEQSIEDDAIEADMKRQDDAIREAKNNG